MQGFVGIVQRELVVWLRTPSAVSSKIHVPDARSTEILDSTTRGRKRAQFLSAASPQSSSSVLSSYAVLYIKQHNSCLNNTENCSNGNSINRFVCLLHVFILEDHAMPFNPLSICVSMNSSASAHY